MKTKNLVRFLAGLLLTGGSAYCQILTVGTAGMSVQPGTVLSLGGLVLQPSATLSMASTSVTASTTPVSVNGAASIAEVYNFSSPQSYTGTAALFYTTAGLNGNAAANLVVAYNNSTGGSYTLNCGSIADTVTQTVTSETITGTSLYNVTAVQSTITVDATSGAGAICAGITLALSNATGGGSWSSSDVTVATVDGAGVVSGIAAGTATISYAVTNGCNTAVATVEVTINANPMVSGTPTAVNCSMGSDGSIATSVTGGTSPYSYAWTGGASGANPTGLIAGIYTVTVTDTNGCWGTTNVHVDEPSLLIAYSATGAIACHGGTTTVTVDATGGTTPYSGTGSYSVSAGGYSYTVIDAHGCTSVTTGTVTEPDALVASATGVVICLTPTMAVTITATGGTSPYSGTGTFTDSVGTHSYTVTDANGCSASVSYTVTVPPPLHLTGTVMPVSCNGLSNGSINTTMTGGVVPYTYAWSNGLTVADPSSLVAGTYSVTATDSNGCALTGIYTVGQPAALAVTATVTPVSLCGRADGGVNTTVTGGTPGYSYTWNTGAHFADLMGVPPGTYSVTVTDAHSCTTGGSWTVEDPCGEGGKSGNAGQHAVAEMLNIFPNPTTGLINVVIPTEYKQAEIVISDLSGKQVVYTPVAENNGEPVHISLAGLAKGMYMVQVNAGAVHYIAKVVVE